MTVLSEDLYTKQVKEYYYFKSDNNSVLISEKRAPLSKVTPRLNEYIQNYQDGTLKAHQFVCLFDNLAELEKKVIRWNEKVDQSKWVSFVNIFLKIVTLNHYKYRKSLKAEVLDLSSFRLLYNKAQNEAATKIQKVFRGYKARKEYLEIINSPSYKLRNGAAKVASGALPVVRYIAGEVVRQAPRMIAAAIAKEAAPVIIDAVCTYGPRLILSAILPS